MSHATADIAAANQLDHIRQRSRAAAEKAYASGPGRKALSKPAPQTELARKRARKTKSAYTSRFHAKIYADLLLEQCQTAERETEALRARKEAEEKEAEELRWNVMRMENEVLRRQVQELREEAARRGNGMEVAEEEEVVVEAEAVVQEEAGQAAGGDVCEDLIYEDVLSELSTAPADSVVSPLGSETSFEVMESVGAGVDQVMEGDVSFKLIEQLLGETQPPSWESQILEQSCVTSTQVA